MENKMKTGVDYNIDNKENKENEYNILSRNNGFFAPLNGIATDVAEQPHRDHNASGQKGEENDSSRLGITQPTPVLNPDEIVRASIQFYDNGEKAPQRYKIKVSIDLLDESRAEFIASLTKDMRNFKKYIPENCRTMITHLATAFRKDIKQQHNTYPYLGKFHLNQGRGHHVHSQVEPNTFVAIWFDPIEKGWAGELMIYDWTYRFDLFDDYVTEKQKKSGVKCQDIWINPKHDKRQRPLTWAEQRAQRLNKQS
jgi:hypothetical protein